MTAQRIRSIDFFRGLTMFLLAGEASSLFEHLRESSNPLIHFVGFQLEHHDWHGLHFWDLIQPFFMFIVGVSIPFSIANRIAKGEERKEIIKHAFKRSLILLFFGWGLYFVDAGHLVFRFQNVLAQLSFTYLVAFLISEKSFSFQLIVSLAILLGIDIAYRFFPVEGFNHPWVNYENLGAWFNNKIEGVEKASEWATLNFISTTAHTIWGVLCGKLLMDSKTLPYQKLRPIIISGILCLAIGFGLDIMGITPIIKKIATSSFVFASGGWCMLMLALCYWMIDVKQWLKKLSVFFIIVGSNSIFIYMFFSTSGAGYLMRMAKPFSALLFEWMGEYGMAIMSSMMVWAGMWSICYWLYRKKIFFRI